ncbi:MAG: hypothetical protein ABF335_13395 [Alphaproteobacteria bacterium]
MRQAVFLGGLWIAIAGLLFGVFFLDWDDWAEDRINPDECSTLPDPYLWGCRQRQRNHRLTYSGNIYAEPHLQDFPALIDKQGWKPLGDDFQAGPTKLHSSHMNLSFDVREGERAAVDRDVDWAVFQFQYSCASTMPRAVVYARDGDQLGDVSVYYFSSVPEPYTYDIWSRAPIDMDNAPWPDLQAIDAVFGGSRERDRAAMAKVPEIPRGRDIEFLEAPRSLSNETGIKRIATYAFRISFVNRDGTVEVSSTNRVIVLPYRDGNLQLVSMITRLDGSKPAPKAWQHLWRNMTFDDGPPTGDQLVGAEGKLLPGKSLHDFILGNSHCRDADDLPPRWAWPRDVPRYR